MSNILQKVLAGQADNHLLPFFWQHGEDEAVLRDYMRAINESGCGAVCVESRPHPDFCGPKWWQDMDVILDEARNRGMKVWILDDSHFPTGYANGAVENAPEELCRQSICVNKVELCGEAKTITLSLKGLIPPPFTPNMMEQHVLPRLPKPRQYADDSILHVSAFCANTKESIDLSACVQDDTLVWDKPEGDYALYVCGLSRNCGPHRNYINMLDRESCRLLIDAVYEPHWQHYQADFGRTMAGFFSDEPELGNGHLYDMNNPLGTDQDLPFGREMPAALALRLGQDWPKLMYLLWENGADAAETAKVRTAFMDAVTSLVETNFSWQMGDWCRAHGVQYIGHVVEDSGGHARTGSSLGHYFRGLAGQDMAGIDDIGGQVYPQGEDDNKPDFKGTPRAADFFHFLLGRLASSAAAIEPQKKGNAMCEIFGNYGWAEGVRLEKYLADHFMARGVNYFVPHAFSPKAFPDPDCPPHFYAHGHNPQFRHFGALMRYMNRVCTLTSAGAHAAEVALLYHAEAEWAGACMPCELPARVLEENQIGFDIIPSDVFINKARYNTMVGDTLQINDKEYKAFVIPESQFIPEAAAKAAEALQQAGFPVIHVKELDQLADNLKNLGIGETLCQPSSTYLRVLHTLGADESFFVVNEGAKVYEGTVTLPGAGPLYAYNPWDNRLETLQAQGTAVTVKLEPLKSLFIVRGTAPDALCAPIVENGTEVPLSAFTRSVCESIDYPAFAGEKQVSLPDELAAEQPEFSGFVRYTASFEVEKPEGFTLLITDAAEGVEVFVNGASAGIQIAPPFRYELSALAQPGINQLTIEVATTLERKCYPMLDMIRKMMVPKPSAGSGITGIVRLFQKI